MVGISNTAAVVRMIRGRIAARETMPTQKDIVRPKAIQAPGASPSVSARKESAPSASPKAEAPAP